MNVRLVLASSPVALCERYGAFAGAGSTEPSFGLVCLAASAQRAGAHVAIVEASSRTLTVAEAYDAIMAETPDIVGFTATTSEIGRAAELAERIKRDRPDVLTVIGGCHATAIPQETLDRFPAFDLAAIGEGEETLCEILGKFHAGDRRPAGVAGTAHREGTAVRVNAPRALIHDLDALPLPAWSLLSGFPRHFRPSPARIRRWPCASVVLTRGCPNQCVFCDRSVFGNRCRAYSPARALEMIRDLRDNFGVRELLIEDDTFVIVPSRVKEFCERMIREKMAMSWSCLGRADRASPELLRLMKAAGCWHISFGIESGDPAILTAMRKRLDLDQIRQAVAWSREAGLRTKGFFIVGFPGETRESLAKTQAFALSLQLDDISVMQMTPFPGSELYSMADEAGTFDRDWTRMNVLNTVFVPRGFTAADLEGARADMLRAFYMRPGVLWRQGLRVLAHPRLIGATVSAFGAFRRVTR